MKLQFIGGGKMGQALLGGLIGAGWGTAEDFHVSDPSPEIHTYLRSAFPGVSVADQPLPDLDTLLATKPHFITDVAATLVRPGRVLSIAAGIGTSAIEAQVPVGTAVLRAMPNTPALHGLGASAVAPGSAANAEDVDWAVGILSSVGVAEIVTEAQIDAVTGLSGSGPAYVFLMAEALTEAGVGVGLSREVAFNLATQTLLGASTMLREPQADPVALRSAVTTPGGTTAAGIASFEANEFRQVVLAAVRAAAERSLELGQPQDAS